MYRVIFGRRFGSRCQSRVGNRHTGLNTGLGAECNNIFIIDYEYLLRTWWCGQYVDRHGPHVSRAGAGPLDGHYAPAGGSRRVGFRCEAATGGADGQCLDM